MIAFRRAVESDKSWSNTLEAQLAICIVRFLLERFPDHLVRVRVTPTLGSALTLTLTLTLTLALTLTLTLTPTLTLTLALTLTRAPPPSASSHRTTGRRAGWLGLG